MNPSPWWTGPQSLGDLLAYNLFGLDSQSHLGSSIHFFIWDVAKILFLLTVIVFGVAIIRSYFSPERSRRILGGKREWVGNILASLLGVVTPFCSCSACPLFIGFIESGIPLGVAMSFLIAAPTVNEVAVILLFGLFGWRVAGLYMITGLLMAIVAGMVIGRLKMERFVEPYVWEIQMGETVEEQPTWAERMAYAQDYTRTLLKKVAPWVLIGVGVAAGIHGYVPVEFVARVAGAGNPFAVPVAVLVGIPLYANAAGTIPIVQVLVEKGVPIGTALALMMSIVAISVPEMLILRQVVKWQLLGVFAAVVIAAIIIIGYMFNVVVFPGGTPPEIMQQLQKLWEANMKITVYGTGCKKCKELFANAEEAVRTAGVEAEVEKVEGVAEIVQAGIMFTPGLTIDGEVKSTGKVPNAAKIASWIREAKS